MNKLILLGLGLFLFAASSRGQSIDVSGGYSYFRLGGSGGLNQNGLSGSVAYNAKHWLGVVGDVGGYHASPSGVSVNTYTYLFGPRLSFRNPGRITPFVQASSEAPASPQAVVTEGPLFLLLFLPASLVRRHPR